MMVPLLLRTKRVFDGLAELSWLVVSPPSIIVVVRRNERTRRTHWHGLGLG